MSNIKRIQDLVSGNYRNNIQTGYEGKTDHQRKEGEEWTDARGRSWKIEDGKRKQITKVPPRGFDKCDDCEKLILKTIDQDTYNRMGRCYYCQIDFEVDLKRQGKWEDWVKEMETKRWEAILAEYKSEMSDIENADSPFDETIAKAIGNHEQSLNKI